MSQAVSHRWGVESAARGARLTLCCVALGALCLAPVRAGAAVIVPTPEPAVGNDLDEVETVGDEDAAQSTRLEVEELALSPAEQRAKFSRGLALGLGSGMPWQTYTVEVGAFLRPQLYLGIYGGGGAYRYSGTIEQRAYDLSIKSNGSGVTLHWWGQEWPHFAVLGSLGYHQWSGSASPHGSDSLDVSDPAKLSSGFRAAGVLAGVAAEVSWTWASGWYLQWVPLGIHKAKIFQQEFTQTTPVLVASVVNTVEGLRIYGMVNLKLGYLF